jgi:hypothetical protein
MGQAAVPRCGLNVPSVCSPSAALAQSEWMERRRLAGRYTTASTLPAAGRRSIGHRAEGTFGDSRNDARPLLDARGTRSGRLRGVDRGLVNQSSDDGEVEEARRFAAAELRDELTDSFHPSPAQPQGEGRCRGL